MGATKDEVAAFMAADFPQSKVVVEKVGGCGAVVSHLVGPASSSGVGWPAIWIFTPNWRLGG